MDIGLLNIYIENPCRFPIRDCSVSPLARALRARRRARAARTQDMCGGHVTRGAHGRRHARPHALGSRGERSSRDSPSRDRALARLTSLTHTFIQTGTQEAAHAYCTMPRCGRHPARFAAGARLGVHAQQPTGRPVRPAALPQGSMWRQVRAALRGLQAPGTVLRPCLPRQGAQRTLPW